MTDAPAIHVEKTVGFGLQRVFVFTFPAKTPPRLPLGIRQPEHLWIGAVGDGAIESMLKSLESWHVPPVLSLAIRCDDAAAVALGIHTYLGRRGNWQVGFVDDVEEFWMEYGRPEHASVEELVTHYRRRAGMTPQVLADAAGIPVTLLHRIEGNPGSVSLDVIQNVVNEMGLTLTVSQKG